MTETLTYRDLNYRFLAHPVSGRLAVVKDAEAVKQGVKLGVMTNRLERPFRPNLGSDVRRQVFENIDSMTEEDVRHSIESYFRDHSRRSELIAVNTYADNDAATLGVTITHRPVNSVEPTVTTIEIEALR